MNKFTVAALQMTSTNDRDSNLKTAERLLSLGLDRGAKLLALPENFSFMGKDERAKLEMTVTPHTFRRSCTTELLRGGAGMYHVKELLGHESLETLRHYARLTITDLKRTHAKCHPREMDDKEQM